MTNPAETYVRRAALMGTIVTVEVVADDASDMASMIRSDAVARALAWFGAVEECCSRFDPTSEVSRLSTHVGEPVTVSPMLLGSVAFALALAEETTGAFDPTVGLAMESRGDNVEYRTGAVVHTRPHAPATVTWRDVHVDTSARTITLLQPLLLDLGAVVKGLAVDLAARELRELNRFAIDAGGDLYLGGTNARGEPWSVGIRHPREEGALLDRVRVSNAAVCTSGDYERRVERGDGRQHHHILDGRTGDTATESVSATVIAGSAMVADALATAAFILGPIPGLRLLQQHGVDGVIVTSDLARHATAGMRGYSADLVA